MKNPAMFLLNMIVPGAVHKSLANIGGLAITARQAKSKVAFKANLSCKVNVTFSRLSWILSILRVNIDKYFQTF